MKNPRLKAIIFDTNMVKDVINEIKTDAILKLNHTKQPYNQGDYIYIRESICDQGGKYKYKADYDIAPAFTWKPSCMMPKKAARLFLKVLDVENIGSHEWKIKFKLCNRKDIVYEVV